MTRGNQKASGAVRFATEVRLIDKRALYGGGALVITAVVFGVANAFGLTIAGTRPMFALLATADLGLALMAIGVIIRAEPAGPTSGPTAPEVEPPPTPSAAGDGPTDLPPLPSVAGRRRAGQPQQLKPGEEKRYRELAVFAGRGSVPPSAVEALWALQGMSSLETAGLLTELFDRSFVQRGTNGLLVVDEVADAAGPTAVAARRSLATAHGRLVDGYRSRCTDGSLSEGPNDGYFFENIAYHMAHANRAQELNRLLLDYDWLRTKLAVCGIIGLLADFAYKPLPADVQAVDDALAMSAARLAARPDSLASQLAGRLVSLSSPGIDRLFAQIHDCAPRPWICPLKPALASTSGPLRLDLPRHDGVLRALAVTPDGNRLISGGDDQTVRVWDLASGRLQHTLHGHTDSVRAVAVTPDGRRIVSGGTYDAVRVWDIESGQFLHSIAGQSGYRAVHAVAVTPDGNRVVWAGAGATVQVWDLANGRLEHALKSQDHAVQFVVLTPDGRSVLSCGDAGMVQIWDLGSGTLSRVLNSKSRPVFSIAVTPDGSRIVSGGGDSSVRVWDFASGRLERTLWGHTGVVDTVAVTRDGSRLVSGGRDKKLLMWDLSTGQEVASWSPDPDTQVTAVCPIPTDPSRVAYGDSAGHLQVLQLLEC